MIGRGPCQGKPRLAARKSCGFKAKGDSPSVRQLVAGNWKMNGLGSVLSGFAAHKAGLAHAACDVLVCPPATLLTRAAATVAGALALGGQDCSPEDSGAFTGDISAAMLKDAGASSVILGHSERRQIHGETDSLVAAKAQAAWRAGLSVIICVGETDAERGAGQAHAVCNRQIHGSVPKAATAANTAIAYEPVWAIGSGKTPTNTEIEGMHGYIRDCLVGALGAAGQDIRILYGGSVKPANAAEILSLPHVGGALVGGASLDIQEFLAIIAAVKPL
jgi:triosephosphate isomerase